jgi:putative sterol carrier protein
MAYKFATDEWVKALMEELNKSTAYAEAAATWEGDFYFIVEGPGAQNPQLLYMDLWHGKCREAFLAADESAKSPAFRITGNLESWKQVLTKKLDPIQGMVTGQLKLKGNMAAIMKSVKAAKELVEATTRVPTEFPA